MIIRKHSFFVAISCILFLSCAIDIVDLTGNISGTVKDYTGGQFIENCQVSLNPGGKSTTTASNGAYEFNDLQPGDYTLSFSKAGYYDESTTVSVVAGQTSNVSAMLKAKSAFALSETLLDFADLETSKTFYAFNNSDADCSFTISNSPDWLHLNQKSGVVNAMSSECISATIDRNSVGYGNYSQTMNVSYSGKTSGSVSLIVKFAKVQLTVPNVSIADKADNITQNSFDIKGNIKATGGSLITNYGHCWSTSENPTVDDYKTSLGSTSSIGEFTSNIAQLSTFTTYYVRAYAKNAQGITYSDAISVTTQNVASDKWDGNIATSFAGGSGSFIDPYIVKTGGQLLLAKNYSDKFFELAGNIDLDNKNWLPYEFKGTLDGKGYQISNLYINRTDDYQGLFSKCSGKVSNLTIKNVSINAPTCDCIGAISGRGGSISDCVVDFGSSSSLIGNQYVGGISGANSIITNSIVKSSSNTVVIKGNISVGGIIGYINCEEEVLIDNVHVSCDISGSESVGGVVGHSKGSKYLVLQNSSYKGCLSGSSMIGGIIGRATNTDGYSHTGRNPDYDVLIKNCKVDAIISASSASAGGIVGSTNGMLGGELFVISCYSKGNITATSLVGGLISDSGKAILSYSTMTSSASSYYGLGNNVSGEDCATVYSKLSDSSCDNCKSSWSDVTTFLRECFSGYAANWNFNKSWIWEGSVGGGSAKVNCPCLSWEH